MRRRRSVVERTGKVPLAEPFKEALNDSPPIIVERIAKEIDEIVGVVRFPDRQNTSAGERDVKRHRVI